MAHPIRFVATTYNLWGTNRWPQREAALRAYLRLAGPDLLALQELRPETRAVLDEELKDHQRVEDPFEGWSREGNLYWSGRLFERIEHGAEEIGISSSPLRRLFWVRLRIKPTGRSLLMSTAHYTYQGHPHERETGQSPRIEQARQTVAALNRLERPEEPILFMGDLNDPNNALRALRAGGLRDSFESLGRLPLITWPASPTAGRPDKSPRTIQVLDWQLNRGPIRVMNCDVADFYLEDLAPSDHKPLSVTYAIED